MLNEEMLEEGPHQEEFSALSAKQHRWDRINCQGERKYKFGGDYDDGRAPGYSNYQKISIRAEIIVCSLDETIAEKGHNRLPFGLEIAHPRGDRYERNNAIKRPPKRIMPLY